MDCGISAYPGTNPAPPIAGASKAVMEPRVRSPAKAHKDGLHVNFETEKVEIRERKQKFLTAKYGTHQMSLIKKRLGVEMWVYDELQCLFGCKDDTEAELDLDELLDIDSETDRRNWLLGKLENATQSQDKVLKFIDELLKRAKTL